MNTILEKLKDVSADCCVTIILQTHRTFPDSDKDSIVLKNLIKEAETRLHAEYPKQVSTKIIGEINDLAEDINHRHNLESLVIFANENLVKLVRLPIHVENRVVIDKTFATRDLVRALHQQVGYYVLVLSRDKARLIEAFDDKVVEEITEGFPVVNLDLKPSQRAEASIANRLTNLNLEFFNRVDKQLVEVLKANPMSVTLCTEESNYAEYLKIADRKDKIVGHLNGNRMQEAAHHIIDAAWPLVKQYNDEKNRERLSELHKAVNTQKFFTDFNEIWKAVNDGRGKTLFVKQGYFQPARLKGDEIELVSPDNYTQANVDDIIDEMIERNLRSGGDTVFVHNGDLEKFQGLALVTRY